MTAQTAHADGGAIIVGASSGIGAAVARELAGRGYRVALLARTAEPLERLSAEINAAHGPSAARAYPHDVRDFDAVPALFDRILTDFAPAAPRLLVYAAGVMPHPADGQWTFDAQREMIETNLLGAMRWLDLAAAYFVQAKGGVILGVSSVAGERGRTGNAAYMASKSGLSVYLESLRYRLARYGVRVVTIKPGYVDTPMIAGTKTPGALVAAPEAVARRIADAASHGSEVVFTPGWWAPIIALVKALPAFVMKRLAV